MIDVEVLLREALIEDAQAAPELPDRWEGATSTVGPYRGLVAPAHWARQAVWIAAAAAIVISLIVASTGDQTTHPTWQPPGIEFPLIDLGRSADLPPDFGPIVEGVTRRLEVEGHSPIDVYSKLLYTGEESAVERRCADDSGSVGCGAEATTSVFSTKPFDQLWIWLAVPGGTSVVGYLDGAQTKWQRPIANVVMFRDSAGDDRVAVAYDINGNELGRSPGASAPTQQPAKLLADISRDQRRELTEYTDESMRACLANLGGTSTGTLVTFDDDTDGEAAWRRCVLDVQASLRQRIVEMSVRFFNPSTQAPSAEDSPYITIVSTGPQPGG